MGITKPCTQLHPSPPSSTLFHPPPPSLFQPPHSSNHLHTAHFSLHLAFCNTLNNIWTKILHLIVQFPQILAEKLKVVHFDWKLTHMVYWGIDSESRLRFLKFRPQNPFFGKFGPKNSKLSLCLKIGTHSILRMLIPNPDLYFWANLGPKSQSCLFCLKIGTHDISKMLILIPTLVFWISNPNSLFGQIWAKKVKVFNWELT